YPFFGVQSTVSGVGLNIAKALTTLGNQLDLASLIGEDEIGWLARKALAEVGIDDHLVLSNLAETAQSVILYEMEGRRQIHTDLKDIQQQAYPILKAQKAIEACDLAVICNINFARPLLAVAKEAGKPIATDVHALVSLDHDYNQDYMRAGDILFMSDEKLPESLEEAARKILDRFNTKILVIGMGKKGALLAVREDGFIGRFEAVKTRKVVNSIGAGDALFSSFLDRYLRTGDPYTSLKAAMVFASYKIGEKGAAQGFLNGEELDAWVRRIY
ncbi:MAG: carbohydrate kinase family protein, partial [Brevefilum sp.]|nr:carbohydrate kinase family protein [Brevefilum sp.]